MQIRSRLQRQFPLPTVGAKWRFHRLFAFWMGGGAIWCLQNDSEEVDHKPSTRQHREHGELLDLGLLQRFLCKQHGGADFRCARDSVTESVAALTSLRLRLKAFQ